MKPVFVDTGAWIAVVEPRDRLHKPAAAHLAELIGRKARLITTNYVVAETATQLRYDSGVSVAVRFRDRLAAAAGSGRLDLVWVDEELEGRGWALLEKYADVRLSMTDAISAVVARAAKVQTVFGFDADFRALGLEIQPDG